jgi:hypothetical protein
MRIIPLSLTLLLTACLSGPVACGASDWEEDCKQVSDKRPAQTDDIPAPQQPDVSDSQPRPVPPDLQPTPKPTNAAQAKKPNFFLNPPPVSWLDKVTGKVKGTAKAAVAAPAEVATGTGRVLRDRRFWAVTAGAAAAGGAGVGMYYLMKDAKKHPPDQWVRGYRNSNGTWVKGYRRTNPDGTLRNNYSYYGNVNPYTGQPGWVVP